MSTKHELKLDTSVITIEQDTQFKILRDCVDDANDNMSNNLVSIMITRPSGIYITMDFVKTENFDSFCRKVAKTLNIPLYEIRFICNNCDEIIDNATLWKLFSIDDDAERCITIVRSESYTDMTVSAGGCYYASITDGHIICKSAKNSLDLKGDTPDTQFTMISVGRLFIAAITFFGEAYCWDVKGVKLNIPKEYVQMKFKMISVGEWHIAAITKEGLLVCLDYSHMDRTCPLTPSELQTILNVPTYNGEKYKMVSAGYRNTVAITLDGQYIFWGDNTVNMNPIDDIEYNDLIIKRISMSLLNTVAVTTNNRVIIWGGHISNLNIDVVKSLEEYNIVSVCGNQMIAITNGKAINLSPYFNQNDNIPKLDDNETFIMVSIGPWFTIGKTSTNRTLCWRNQNTDKTMHMPSF